ncbi:MAG: hypothetical protein KGZ68_01040 [Dechloromonas sp.]|nr:hypothetical protein [Dechloromonas sp.]
MLIVSYFALYMVVVFTSRVEPFLFLRIVFIGAPGAMCCLALWSGSFVSPHMVYAQTEEYFRFAIILNAVGLVSARVGWYIGGAMAKASMPSPLVYTIGNTTLRNVVLALAFAVIIWFAEGRGDTIFEGRYGGEGSRSLPLGNVNAIINILIATVLYFLLTKRSGREVFVFIVLAIVSKVVYANLIRGIRADALDTLIMIFVIIGVYNSNYSKVRTSHIIFGLSFLIVLQFIGIVRSSFYTSGLGGLESFSIFRQSADSVFISISTIGDITATFIGFLWLPDTGYALDAERTYLGYILRIPPEFLYPARPDDISWVFGEQGLTSGGGSFELGEAYITFGLAGVVIVPMILSIVFSYLIGKLKVSPSSIVYFILLASILAVFSRGAWYQTFAYFKSFVTGLMWLAPVLLTARLTPNINVLQQRSRDLRTISEKLRPWGR